MDFKNFIDYFTPIRHAAVQLVDTSWSRMIPATQHTPQVYFDVAYEPDPIGRYPEVTHAHLTLRGFGQFFHFYTQDMPGVWIGSLQRYLNIDLKDFWLMSRADLLEQRRPGNEHIAHLYDWDQDDKQYTYCLIFNIGGSTFHLRTFDDNQTFRDISQYSSERLYYSKVGFGGGARR